MAARLGYTAYYTRQAIKWFVIGVIIYGILLIAWSIIKPFVTREPPPPPIVPKFGGLPGLDLPTPDPNLKFVYKLETITGALPTDFPDRAKIFLNKKVEPGFFSLDASKRIAARLGFKQAPIPVSPPIYQWKDISQLPGLLEMNVTTSIFDMVRNWRNDQTILQSNVFLSPEQAFNIANKALSASGSLNDDLKKGEHGFLYFKILNGQLIKVTSISEADLVQVNFKRQKIDKLSTVFADPERPTIWALIARNQKLVEFHYHYLPWGTETSEYPIRPIQAIWQDLIEGRAYIARLGDNVPGSEVVIRHFELAYYESQNFQDFTQPVFIVSGDKNFMALVPAIDASAGVVKKK